MNPHTNCCLRCDRLLTAFGEAVLHRHEIKRARRQSEFPELEYQSAESKCQRLRTRLLRHLNQHEHGISVLRFNPGAPAGDAQFAHE